MPRDRKPLPALDNASTINNPDLPNIYNRNYTDTILKYGGLATRFSQLETNAKTIVAAINELYENGDETKHRTLTQAEYDELSEEEKNNGTIYFISDAGGGGGGASSLAELDDVVLSELLANQVLTYDGENWVNSAYPIDLSDTTSPLGHFLWNDGVTWKPSPYFIIDLKYEPSQQQMLYYSGSVWGYIDAPLVTNVNLPSDLRPGAVLYYNGNEWTADDVIRFHVSYPEDRELLSYDASTGEWVNKSIGNAIDLNELGNVSIESPSDGDVLMYATGSWVNYAFNIPENIEDLQDVSVSSPDDGQVLKYYDGQWINANESGGGSTVSVTQIQSTGTKIATVSVDAVDTDLYAPNPGSTVSVNPIQSTGTKIATITVDSTSSDLYAPSAVSSVNVSQIQTVGTKIATITVDGSGTDLYAPTSGGASTLAGLSDVTLTSPTNNQVLKYDSTNNVWVNGADSGGSVVSVTQIQSTGTKIATITVDSVGTDLYAPQSGASALNDLTDVAISSPTNNQALIYDSANSQWVNGTVSGGHTILDNVGTSLTQRDDLQFKGAYSEDDSTNDKTIVNVARTMTLAEFEQLTDAEKAGFINVVDETSGSDDKFQPVIYSEEEREIGVWTDGKPLYEKTYHNSAITISSNTELTIDDFSDKFPISCYGVMHNSTDNRTYYPNWAYNAGGQANIFYRKVDNGNLVLRSENDSWSNTWEVFTVVRYTKDSDAAGSGQWTPQGVPAVHYSTDEQIVGTWIDGSTLYEKTVVGDDTYNQQFNYIPHGVSNIDKIVDYFGYCYYGGTDFSLIPYLRGSTYITVTVWDNTNIRVEKTGLSSSFTGLRLVIRYTKSST